jgi:hypothetical protein
MIGIEKCVLGLMENLEGKRLCGRHRCNWKENIKRVLDLSAKDSCEHGNEPLQSMKCN